MSAQPQERLSTADMVAAGQPAPGPQDVDERHERSGETGSNVRKLERPARMQSDGERLAALLPGDETGELRRRWDIIQTGFVDEPRHAVEEADSLVAQTMKRVAEIFAQERSNLEQQWSRGEDVSTEDLRVALKRYRSFFDRLLTV
jgi:hypothetical protein